MRSLRGRLTLGVTVLLAAVLLIGGTIVAHEVSHTERQGLDDKLKRTAEFSRATALAAVEQQLPSADTRLDAVLKADSSSVRVSVGGQVLVKEGEPPPGKRVQFPLGLHTTRVAGRDYRTYAEVLHDPDLGGLARIEVTSRLSEVENNESNLRRKLALIGLAMLLVAGAGVWFAGDVVLRPLRRLRQATARIADDTDLERGVPVDDGPAELRSLATSFDAMLSRLRRSAADRTRALDATRRFAADAGHELRTPLTSVQATLSTLARHPELDPQRRTEMAEEALVEQRRLVDLLDGLQALARGDSQAVDEADVDLADLVDSVVENMAVRQPATEFKADLPEQALVVRGWEPGLRMIVENLVANAARHGSPKGVVRVSLGAAPDSGGAVLEVEDDGPGIPEAERARVFEPFARLEGVKQPGSGLGLALVAQQALQHSAVLSISDSDLGGARFTVRFRA